LFIETSAFESDNVNTAFEELLNAVSEVREVQIKSGKQPFGNSKACLKLNDAELNKDETNGCCGF